MDHMTRTLFKPADLLALPDNEGWSGSDIYSSVAASIKILRYVCVLVV